MKIKFIQTLSTTRETYRRHTVHDLPEVDAKHMISAGMATEAEAQPEPTVEAPVLAQPQAQPKAKRQRKGQS